MLSFDIVMNLCDVVEKSYDILYKVKPSRDYRDSVLFLQDIHWLRGNKGEDPSPLQMVSFPAWFSGTWIYKATENSQMKCQLWGRRVPLFWTGTNFNTHYTSSVHCDPSDLYLIQSQTNLTLSKFGLTWQTRLLYTLVSFCNANCIVWCLLVSSL